MNAAVALPATVSNTGHGVVIHLALRCLLCSFAQPLPSQSSLHALLKRLRRAGHGGRALLLPWWGRPDEWLHPTSMSVVTLQLGQCGNQIGEQLFGRLRAEAEGAGTALKSATLARFFREGAAGAGGGAGGGGSRDHGLNARKTAGTDGCAPKGDVLTARAVLVDMEPKVCRASRATPHLCMSYPV